MRRRDFIRLLGGAAAWPIAAQAQQPTMPLIGFLGPALNTRRHWLAEFGKGLGAEGFVEGQNVGRGDYRNSLPISSGVKSR
jgi:putative tryptophan/tyrosine transport system substrate-binding protein